MSKYFYQFKNKKKCENSIKDKIRLAHWKIWGNNNLSITLLHLHSLQVNFELQNDNFVSIFILV